MHKISLRCVLPSIQNVVVTNLYQKMTLPQLLRFLRPNLRKPDTARPTVPETTVVNVIDATESTSEVVEDYIVTE